MLREIIKNALTKAIKSFITMDELFSDDFIRRAADDWVYEHDEEVRDQLRDSICLDETFEDVLSEIDYDDIF